MTRKAEIFAAYGDDAESALRNWQQVDPDGYGQWSATVEQRTYVADYRRWASRQLSSVRASALKPKTDQARLFQPADGERESVEIRRTIVHDGTELVTAELAGLDGAQKLREAALRDLGPAETTAKRCRRNIEIAALIEAETIRLGRPVSVGEVLHMERAA